MTDVRTSHADQRTMPEVPEYEVPAAVVSMLFAAHEAASLSELGQAVGYDVRHIRAVLHEIEPELERLGLLLQWPSGDRVQLATRPSLSGVVRRFLGIDRATRLSPAALETVAIIAYRQPVTRPEIDAVRGVDSSGVIQTLLAHEIIEPVGRLPGPGNPIQFGTTGEFLRLFGLASLTELPELPEELEAAIEQPDDVVREDSGDSEPDRDPIR